VITVTLRRPLSLCAGEVAGRTGTLKAEFTFIAMVRTWTSARFFRGFSSLTLVGFTDHIASLVAARQVATAAVPQYTSDMRRLFLLPRYQRDAARFLNEREQDEMERHIADDPES
jgi:hypothetical protein